jgi:hypothetical protein
MDVSIQGRELIIRLPLLDATPSASGKTLVVATTRGNQKTDLRIDGKVVTVGVNAYISGDELPSR